MMEPLVSVITAAYNSEKTVAETIESVLGQTYGSIEYIIADGASSDRTVEIAESYRPEFERRGYRYTIISSRDSGIYAGINKGIAKAHGILAGCVNADDYYEPGMVQAAAECYLERKYDLFYADVRIVSGSGARVGVERARRMKGMITTRHWNHPTMFVPRRVYRRQKYDESYRYYADFDYMLRLYKRGGRITVVNRPLSNFRLGGASTRGGVKESIRRAGERYRVYRNSGYSRLYLAECLFMDVGKGVAGKIMEQAGYE